MRKENFTNGLKFKDQQERNVREMEPGIVTRIFRDQESGSIAGWKI